LPAKASVQSIGMLTDTPSSRASLAPTRVEVAPIYVLLASDEAIGPAGMDLLKLDIKDAGHGIGRVTLSMRIRNADSTFSPNDYCAPT
jgi:hypothetical protein